MHFEEILNFWFNEIDKKYWFNSNQEIDNLITEKFSKIHEICASNPHLTWGEFPRGILAKIIVLDQFSRMIFRNREEAFYNDEDCVQASLFVIENCFDKNFNIDEKMFCYMPLMHSENLNIQTISLEKFKQIGNEPYEFAVKHFEIIKKFGRFPHRNDILNRKSTIEEIIYLKLNGGF